MICNLSVPAQEAMTEYGWFYKTRGLKRLDKFLRYKTPEDLMNNIPAIIKSLKTGDFKDLFLKPFSSSSCAAK